ncbi:substrate-binding domain-containing protein [Solirhodobacter olei]|uniref:substrate-binding domain-containing protein n=1 Tax=Solirhodobacter olei TaxID=2493082 RepID=UPI000FD969E2|nr:substrate-binding domain-containing protein [Solirhodobacter olei]
MALGKECDAVAVTAADHPVINHTIRDLREQGKPVVSYITDQSAPERAAYVGTDNWKLGRTAGYLMAQMTNGPGRVAVFIGNHWSADAIGWQPLGWEQWFHAQGARWERGPSSFSTNKVALLIEAALAGEGVMLGWQHMVRRFLDEGRLVVAHPAPVTAGRGNFLRCQTASLQRPAVARFVDHLLASLKA